LNLLSTILHIFKTNKQPVEDEPHEIRFKRKYNDLGIFQYDENSFTVQLEDKQEQVNWTEVERLRAYKADLITIDLLCMEIWYRNRRITITEDTPGWYQFVLKTKNIFTSIPEDWDINIIQPAFVPNLTVLYEREDRVMPEKNNFYAAFTNTTKKRIISAFEHDEWNCREIRASEYELDISWAEFILHGEEDAPLLSGIVAYDPDNVAILDRILKAAGGLDMYEFYDEHDNILAEWKRPL
jgi:hypothetical protein